MRILLDEENLSWDEAWEITKKTVSYTNHTIMSEAMENYCKYDERTITKNLYDNRRNK